MEQYQNKTRYLIWACFFVYMWTNFSNRQSILITFLTDFEIGDDNKYDQGCIIF